MADPPLPTMTTDSGGLPMASLKTVSTCWVVICPSPRGNDTLVPPSKSMPKVKPRNTIAARAIATMTPLIVYQSVRLPITSKAPVPVYSRTKKPCLGASAPADSRSGASTAPDSIVSVFLVNDSVLP